MKTWRRKIENKEITVGVLGLGYTGLPLAKQFAAKGFEVIGFDISREKIETLCKHESPISSISNQEIQIMFEKQGFKITEDMSDLKKVDAILVCVPTPLTHDREPDMKHIYDSSRMIAKYLRRGQIIIIKSTSYPGTTREIIMPELEKSGLKAGEDFHLAYSPEREDPGRKDYRIDNTTKVVGGLTPICCDKACTLFDIIVKTLTKKEVDTFPVSTLEIAEAAKILENVYRFVNISLVNELKRVFDKMGIDIWQVIAAAETKPFGFEAFSPGPGVGGHCIAIDPYYMIWIAAQNGMNMEIVEAAGRVNNEMPRYVVGKIKKEFEKKDIKLGNLRILVLGVTYKKNTADLRESPSVDIIKLLRRKGAEVNYHDPHVPKVLLKDMRYDSEMASIKLSNEYEEVANYDVVVIATDHDEYDYDKIAEKANLVIDTRNAIGLDGEKSQNVIKA